MAIPRLGPHGEGWVLAQLAVGGAVAVLGARHQRSAPPERRRGRAAAAIGAALMVLGVSTIVRGARDLGSSLTPMPRPLDDAQLVEDGIYAAIRHPIYSGVIGLCAGWAIFTGSRLALMAAAVESLVFLAKSSVEEEWLRGRYPGYAAYEARTRRFIPGLL